MLLNLRLRLRDFYKKYKWILVAIIIAWVIMIVVNHFLESYDPKAEPSSTYTPNTPIMAIGTTNEGPVSGKLNETFENVIEQYILYCNNKEYDKIYEMLNDDCKKDVFSEMYMLREYLAPTYLTKKVYTVQNYYNEGSIYVYRIRLFDDILATGLTGEDKLQVWTELIAIDTSKKELKISIGGYIERQKLNAVYEDSNMKITVTSLKKEYERETYTVKITNRTETPIILLDNQAKNEITLRLDAEDRLQQNSKNSMIFVNPGQTIEKELVFNKYFHESDTSQAIKFNNVRIVKLLPATYNQEGEIQDAISTYSMQIKLTK